MTPVTRRAIRCSSGVFRSVLETRYATFFDALGVRFVYEPFRLKLNDRDGYTVDFALPDLGAYVEIKGTWHEDDHEWPLYMAARLARYTGQAVFIAYGQFPQAQEDASERWNMLRVPATWASGDPIPAQDYAWSLCLACGAAYIYSAATPACTRCGCGRGDDIWDAGGSLTHQIRKAYYFGNGRR